MSVMNCFVTPEAAHIFSDGGCYEPHTMVLEGFGNKVAIVPQLNAVIAATGYSFVAATLAIMLVKEPFETFDELAADFSGFVQKAIKDAARLMGAPPNWGSFEVILAGWSGFQDGPRAFHLTGYKKGGWPAFRVQECTRFRSPASINHREFEFDPTRPGESGLELMRMQRLLRCAPAHKVSPDLGARSDDDLSYIVSGFAQHTAISRNEISIKVLEQWPDRIGQVIRPIDRDDTVRR